MATAARIVAMELQRLADAGLSGTEESGTFAEVGATVARRLDRAGLITRSE